MSILLEISLIDHHRDVVFLLLGQVLAAVSFQDLLHLFLGNLFLLLQQVLVLITPSRRVETLMDIGGSLKEFLRLLLDRLLLALVALLTLGSFISFLTHPTFHPRVPYGFSIKYILIFPMFPTYDSPAHCNQDASLDVATLESSPGLL
jgi:hypothetical protein